MQGTCPSPSADLRKQQLKESGAGGLARESSLREHLLAGLLGIRRVHIAWAVKNTSDEGVAASYDFHHGKNALLLHVANSPGLNTPSAGYTFQWSGLFGAGENGIRIKRFRMEQIASDRVEAEEALDQKVVSSELGYFYSAAIS